MSERENTSLPEKTLKQKVEFGKRWLKKCAFDTGPGLDAITALEGKLKEYEELYEDPCHAERITDEDTGEPQWLLHIPKDPPEVLENHISLDPAAYEEGTRVCIYEPIKEARS